MQDIIIFGAGGFSKDVHFLIDLINEKNPTYNVLGFVDDNFAIPPMINGVPYLGTKDHLDSVEHPVGLVMAISDSELVKQIVNKAKINRSINFPNLIHPNTVIDLKFSTLGIGNIINAGCIISRNTHIGDFNILNNDTAIGHDVVIGNYNNFSPKTQISGGVSIGNNNFFGLNTAVIQYKTIGNDNFIGACSLLTKNLKDGRRVFGIPAKNLVTAY